MVDASINQSKGCDSTACAPSAPSSTSEWALPSRSQVTLAASLPIIDEHGTRVSFGSLFATQRAIVIFIRHFWCPLCQDYMFSVKSFVDPEMLSVPSRDGKPAERVQFAVIGNGAYGMIAKYRQIFGLPFRVYTDPSQSIYAALGMGRDTPLHNKGNRHHHHSVRRPSLDILSEKAAKKVGGYVKHNLMSGIALVVVRAIKVGMPVWEKGGDIGQLGGEFILGPGLKCTYAHRMQTTRGHAPIQDVLHAAGLTVPATPHLHLVPISTTISIPTTLQPMETRSKSMDLDHFTNRRRESTITILGDTISKRDSRRHSISMMTREEEDRWMENRQRSIERLQEKKNARRGLIVRAASLPLADTEKSSLEAVGEVSENALSGTEDERGGEDERLADSSLSGVHEDDSSHTPTSTLTEQTLHNTDEELVVILEKELL